MCPPAPKHYAITLIFEAISQFCDGCSFSCSIYPGKNYSDRFWSVFDEFIEIKATDIEHF